MRAIWMLCACLGWFAWQASAEVVTRPVEYEIDGVTHRGVLVFDDAKASAEQPVPGVMVVPEWWGLNDYAKKRATMLAELGYIAFAADMYGLDEATGEPKVTTAAEQAQQWSGALYGNRELFRKKLNTALDAFREQPELDGEKLAAIGYCFGGTAVLELAYSGADVDAVVSFHGSVMPPTQDDDLGEVEASVLICHGVADPMYGLDELHAVIEALERGGVDYAVIGYGHAVHSFTNPGADGSFHPGVKYDAKADARSWQAMQGWLAEAFN